MSSPEDRRLALQFSACALLVISCVGPSRLDAIPSASAQVEVADGARAERRAAVDPPNRRIQLGHADVWLEPEGGAPIRVAAEVAHTDPLRRRGLMGRRHMPPDGGMLFVFEQPSRQSFWMRNTFLSLDIIFIGADRRIVGIVERARPLSSEEQAVEAESQYVLEVHAGFAERHGLETGTLVRFSNVSED